jgi:hypothetical protein
MKSIKLPKSKPASTTAFQLVERSQPGIADAPELT